jgi:hypothetical protein
MRPENRSRVLESAISEWNYRIEREIGLALSKRIQRCTDVVQESNTGLNRYREEAGDSALTHEELLAVWEEHKAYILQHEDEPVLTAEDKYFALLYQYDQAVAEAQRNENHHASIARVERLGMELQGMRVENIEGLEGGR